MFLTTKGRYAVMIMVELASNIDASPLSAKFLSDKLGIKPLYIEQILAKLRGNGMVRSIRGPGGGYCLNKDSSEIKILDIMNAASESLKMTRCNADSGLNCLDRDTKTPCRTHHLWADLEQKILTFLKEKTLASACAQGNGISCNHLNRLHQ